MKLAPPDLKRLSTLLDQALDLPEAERDAWLASLRGDALALAPTLRELLAKQARHETGDLIDRLPAFTPEHGEAAVGQTVGPYRLLRELGQGGMSAVWLAERIDGGPKRQVALKLPHIGWATGLAERFAREREILASLEHPHIARLYDAGLDQRGRPYMALEFVQGKPIDEFCRLRDLNLVGRLRLLLQVTEAVAFAHSRLVVHRDLKPSNILVTDDGQVRLLDFGIAKLMQGDRAAQTALTQAAGRALTLDYASPEQIRGAPIGTASDVYSLGVVAFELLAGERPYRLKRGTAGELEAAIIERDVPLASALVREPRISRALKGDLDAILNKALKKDVAERYATVDALAGDWRRHLQGQRVLARPDTLRYRAARLALRHRVPMTAAAAVAVAFVLAIGFGAAAVVIALLASGLAAALLLTRRATTERDRAIALADRNAAVNLFLETLLTQAARLGPLTATQLLERSEKLIDNQIRGNPEHRAYVLGVLANCHSQLDDPARAAALLERALDGARGLTDAALRDVLASRQALMRGQLGEVERAAATMDAILARGDATSDVRSETHLHRSVLAAWNGDGAAALRHAVEALRWFRASHYLGPRQEAVLLANLGWAYVMRGQGDEALQHFAQAMAVFDRLGLGDSPQAVQTLGNWALAEQEMGDLPRSLELFDQGFATNARAGADTPPSTYLLANRAYTLTQMGHYAQAETGYRSAAEAARQQGAPLLVYNVRMCVVELYADQGRVAEGERELAEADAERTVEAPEGGAGAFARQLSEARLALLRGHPDASLLAFSKSLEDDRPSAGTVTALIGRANAYLLSGRVEAGEADARAALAMSQGLQGRKRASFRTGLAWLAVARARSVAADEESAVQAAAAALAQLEPTVAAGHPALAQARHLQRGHAAPM